MSIFASRVPGLVLSSINTSLIFVYSIDNSFGKMLLWVSGADKSAEKYVQFLIICELISAVKIFSVYLL